jgi:putative acetyltransferase
MNIEIEPIAERHADSFHACLDAVARERRHLAQVEAPPLERVRAFVRENIAAGVPQFVALDAGAVVGWCDILPGWAHARRHVGTLGMAVLASHRGRGIGGRLLAVCLTDAQQRGITRVELEARADNAVAIRLYEQHGFVHEALKRCALRFDGVDFDAVQMSRLR